MENTVEQSPEETKLGDKADCQKHRARSLKDTRADDNLLCQAHHPADLQGIDALHHESALLQPDLTAEHDGNEDAHRDKAQTADLNHGQDDELAK